MGLAASIRTSVRNLISNIGSTATVYSFSSATETSNEEGDTTVSNWGAGTTFKAASSNNYKLRRLLESMGEESNSSERVLIARDDVTIEARDKVIIDNEAYIVSEVKRINPIENVLIAQRIVLDRDERYVV